MMTRILTLGCLLTMASGLASATATVYLGICGTGFTDTSTSSTLCTTQGADGSTIDANWTLTGGTGIANITDPFSTWVANSTSAKWIAPSPNETAGSNGVGPFDYTETFTITAGEDLTTALITGSWASDNGSVLTLNGNVIGTLSGTGTFLSLTSFTINTPSDFLVGLNTLEVAVVNQSATPSGMIMGITTEDINLISASTPEPATFALMGLGLVGLGVARRRLAKR